jgi:hypothetical protein
VLNLVDLSESSLSKDVDFLEESLEPVLFEVGLELVLVSPFNIPKHQFAIIVPSVG